MLSEWGAILIQRCTTEEAAWEEYALELVWADAQVLDLCMSSDTRASVKHSALAVTWRAIRSILRNGSSCEIRVTKVVAHLAAKNPAAGSRNSVFLGAIAGVCARLPEHKSSLAAIKDQYLFFYVRDILGSRTPVPEYQAEAFNDFFSNFVTLEDLQSEIVPALEKALLRAPEVVLDGLVSIMVSSLPSNIDLAPCLASRLLKPLLSNIKSSNPKIRDGAISTFATIISHCQDGEGFGKITDDLVIPLSSAKLVVAEHRALHARMLAMVPFSMTRSEGIIRALITTAAKEQNEAALNDEVSTLSHHLSSIACESQHSDVSAQKLAGDAFSKGLSDKKPAARRAWSLAVGAFVSKAQENKINSPEIYHFLEATIPRLLEIFNEINSNIVNASQSGIVVTGYILVASCTYLIDHVKNENVKSLIRKASIFDQARSSSPKSSFLLSYRIYSRLTNENDLLWAIGALAACSADISFLDSNSVAADAWAQAFLFLITASDVPHKISERAVSALGEIYLKQPQRVASCILKGVWSWLQNTVTQQQDTAAAAAKSGCNRLHLAIHAICPTPAVVTFGKADISSDVLQSQLIDMLVLCHPTILPRVNWIELCLKVGHDPGTLVRLRSEQCLERIKSCSDTVGDKIYASIIKSAAYDAAAELAFVAPDTIIPLLVMQIKADLSADAVRAYGPTELAIARTPEGTTFVDVLSSKGQAPSLDKNVRDYDTLKWEAEIRSQLAKKRGQERKLTTDEKAKVEAQLGKEAGIRQEVLALEKKLKRGIGLIRSLANGPPTDARKWIRPCLTALLGTMKASTGLMVGSAADAAYLDCAKLVSSRVGNLRPFIGIATLRSLDTSIIPEDLQEEPLGGPYRTSLACHMLMHCRHCH